MFLTPPSQRLTDSSIVTIQMSCVFIQDDIHCGRAVSAATRPSLFSPSGTDTEQEIQSESEGEVRIQLETETRPWSGSLYFRPLGGYIACFQPSRLRVPLIQGHPPLVLGVLWVPLELLLPVEQGRGLEVFAIPSYLHGFSTDVRGQPAGQSDSAP
ncbi:hypothetical protein JZ751_005906 [Albula glossodonta]|uniref:Uncharacterized protein n=1 Tax=Albula glossodonta TaxID=121402 RepID=A0A8T2P3V2_9TELE|nr:hypothetical protein JZ751_005906 [Albula glossodonta]